MISRLLLLGATGDLAGRFLLPALARLVAAGDLPGDVRVVGAAPEALDDAAFARHVADRLQRHAGDLPAAARDALLEGLRYRPVDLEDPTTVARAVRACGEEEDGTSAPPVAVYLALPPARFPAAVTALGAADLPAGSRVAVEKPFGDGLADARSLNALLAAVTGGGAGAFRVDHALGMPRVGELLSLRAPGGALEPVWDGAHLAQVDLLWEETLGLEGRAGFFDRAGAVKDVVQNHLLQLLAVVARELPATTDERALHGARLDLLRSVRVLSPTEVAARTRRARYTAGQLAGGGATVPDYAAQEGVDPTRGTETYAELVLEVDHPRWEGTRFVLRAGKALAAPRKGVQLHLRSPVPLAAVTGEVDATADRLWVELDDPREPAPGSPAADATAPRPVPLPPPTADVAGELLAYEAVLRDLLHGGSTLSVSAEEAEQTWRVVESVLQAWAGGSPPLLDYPAGSPGPGHLEPGHLEPGHLEPGHLGTSSNGG